MKSRETVEEALRNKLRFAAASTLRDRWRKEVLQAHVGANNYSPTQTETRPALREPTPRSTIMRNSYVKLALAAVVILAVVLGLTEFLGPGGKSGVAWAHVLEKAEQVPVVIFDMTAEIGRPQGEKLVLPSKYYVAGDYGTRSDTFNDGKLMAIKYRLPNKKVAYQVRVDQKKYWRFDLSEEEAAQGRDPDDPRTWLKMILSGEYTKLGRATINGVVAEGIECNRPEITGGDDVMRLWVDVQTELPVRIEVDMLGMEGGQMKQQKFVMENFEWNAQLDESLFEPNIPADYTRGEDPKAGQAQQENTEAQPAAPQALTEQERAALPQIKETVTLFLQACSNRNWDEMLKHAPGLAKLPAADRTALDTHLGGLEILQVGEPFKTNASNVWRVPCRINGRLRESAARRSACATTRLWADL
jgi:hypothetical protein